jgi:hypothetical protein
VVGAQYQVTVRGSAPQILGPPSNLLVPLTVLPGGPAVSAAVLTGFSVT